MHKSWITYEQVAYNQWQSSNKPRTSHRKVWTTHRQVMKELEKNEKNEACQFKQMKWSEWYSEVMHKLWEICEKLLTNYEPIKIFWTIHRVSWKNQQIIN